MNRTYFHEEQRFRQWWIWTLLAVIALPMLILAATGEPVLPFLVGQMIGSQRPQELEAAIARAVRDRQVG